MEIYRMGAGMCRGAGWQFGVWPIEKGFKVEFLILGGKLVYW